jgi:hypothetical protein
MYKAILFSALCAVLTVPFALNATRAATAKGEFAVEGAGFATCSAFTAARKARGEFRTQAASKAAAEAEAVAGVDSYARFIGWIEGYLTATNRYMDDTFDVAPWQTAELYGVIIGDHCEKNPDERLYTVVMKMVTTLSDDRMKLPSEQVGLSIKGRGFTLYTEVIRRTQDALKKQSLYRGEVTGVWDQPTQLAVASYQAVVGLQDTGLPDPLTLWLLFSPQKTQADVAAANAAAKGATKSTK